MKTAFDLLQQLRLNWIEYVREAWEFAPPEFKVSESTLEQFFQSISDRLLTNQSITVEAFVDGMLARQQASSYAADDFGSYSEGSLIGFIHTLHGALLTASSKVHQPTETLQFIEAIEPIVFHMVEYGAYREGMIQHDLAARDQQAARQAMAMLDESRSRFISMATQNLRTPLTLIEGYLAMLREHRASASELETWVKGMAAGTNKMRAAIDELIDVAMVDNQMLALHYAKVPVAEILDALQVRFKPEAKSRSLSLRIHRCPEFARPIFVDRERIEQSVGYVIENAIRVSPKGAAIHLHGRELSGFLELTVVDHGPGIAVEDQAIIFETSPAAEAQSSLHQQYLGLHLAKGILESHGGAIWVTSPGRDERKFPGSTFHIMIPMREDPPDDLTARLLGM
jgi:signal transduction histidine kinase